MLASAAISLRASRSLAPGAGRAWSARPRRLWTASGAEGRRRGGIRAAVVIGRRVLPGPAARPAPAGSRWLAQQAGRGSSLWDVDPFREPADDDDSSGSDSDSDSDSDGEGDEGGRRKARLERSPSQRYAKYQRPSPRMIGHRKRVSGLVDRFTAPALASALVEREETLWLCSKYLTEGRHEELEVLLSHFGTVGPKPEKDTTRSPAGPAYFTDDFLHKLRKNLNRLPRSVRRRDEKRWGREEKRRDERRP